MATTAEADAKVANDGDDNQSSYTKESIDINENNDDQTTKVPNQDEETKVPKEMNESNNCKSALVSKTDKDNEEEIESSEKSDENEKRPSDNKNNDVENFDGKIVYNPDGSAYIFETDEDDALLPKLPKQEGRLVDSRKEADNNEDEAENERRSSLPQIANAIYVTRSAAYYSALYGRACAKVLREKLQVSPDAPIVHTYKVYSLRSDEDKSSDQSKSPPPALSELPSAVPVKPILMCFICKLSFGYAKSFETHCAGEHSVDLNEEEKSILSAKNSSAIIQAVGKDKKAIVSFLEPVVRGESAKSSGEEPIEQPVE